MSADPWRLWARENWPIPVCRSNSDVSASNNRARSLGPARKQSGVVSRIQIGPLRHLAPRGEVFRGGMSHDLASGALTTRERTAQHLLITTAGGAFYGLRPINCVDSTRSCAIFLWRRPMVLGAWIWAGRPGGIGDISPTEKYLLREGRRSGLSRRRSVRAALRHSRCRRVR